MLVVGQRYKPLTAKEAADRLARHFRTLREPADVPQFTCMECGGHRFKLMLSNGSLADITNDHQVHWIDYRDSDEEKDAENVIWEVYCDDCEHPVEFGWSYPGRGGEIWPVESDNFHPWKCWPEPRFREDWERRGWLRPSGYR